MSSIRRDASDHKRHSRRATSLTRFDEIVDSKKMVGRGVGGS
jgi:hypothetical protein